MADLKDIKVWKFDDCDYVAGFDLAEALQWYFELTGVRVEDIDEVRNLDAPDAFSGNVPYADGMKHCMSWRESINDMINSGEQPPMLIACDGHYA